MPDRFGKYQILEKIGEGGFGVIYKGLDPYIKRHVAVKTCTSEAEDVRARFYNEAQIVGNLHHRNVTTVYDFGVEDEVPYLVQEYLSGEDLDRKIRRRDFLPFPEKLLYLIQVARGLEYAHARGVVHRDIKPGNIRVLEDGTAKIMDFGIAKLAQQDTGLTQTGMTMGTAAYLAPEQIRGEPVDARTDIFSYGLLAYELLTFVRPFTGQQISTLLYQILNVQPKPIVEHWPDCPPELVALVERCLQKEPDRRFASMAEVLRELDALLRKRRAAEPDGSATRSQDVGGLVTRALPQLAAGEGAATAAFSPHSPPTGIGELELSGSGGDADSRPRSSTTAIFRHRGMQWQPWAAGVIALAAVALGVWLLLDPGDAAVPAAGVAAPAGAPAINLPAGATDTALLSFEQIGVTTAGGTTPTGSGAPAGSDASATAAPAVADPALPAPPPIVEEKPRPATLRFARAWSPAIRVRGAGRTVTLDRDRSVEVEPGAYRLQFEIFTADYSATAEQEVRVGAGQTVRVELPLPRPGELTVQSYPQTPRGIVTWKGESLGPTPLRRKQVRPGVQVLTVTAPDGTGPAIRETVEVMPGGHTVVTVDLSGERPTEIRAGAPR